MKGATMAKPDHPGKPDHTGGKPDHAGKPDSPGKSGEEHGKKGGSEALILAGLLAGGASKETVVADAIALSKELQAAMEPAEVEEK
jgi:hypothetical protein